MGDRTTPVWPRISMELRKYQMAPDSKGIKPEWNLSKMLSDILSIVVDLPTNMNPDVTIPIRFYQLDGKMRLALGEVEN